MPAQNLDGLTERWRKWVDVVRIVATRRQEYTEIDPAAYCTLHARLVSDCRAVMQHNATIPPPVLQKLQETVAPWISLDSLAQADRQILCQLLARCQLLSRALEGGGAAWRVRRCVGTALVCTGFLTASAALSLVVFSRNPTSWPAVLAARRWLHWAHTSLFRGGSDQHLLLGGVAASALMMVVVWQSAKRRRPRR